MVSKQHDRGYEVCPNKVMPREWRFRLVDTHLPHAASIEDRQLADVEDAKPGFPIWIRPTHPKAAETLAKPRVPFFTRRVRQDSAT